MLQSLYKLCSRLCTTRCNTIWVFEMFILLCLAMAATLASLAFGFYALMRGEEFHAKYGHQAMQWRITLQGIALLIFAIMLLSR